MGDFCSECSSPTNVLHRKEGRKEVEGRKEGRKEGENQKERERKKEQLLGERVKLTTVSSLELIQESVSCCLLRPLLTTPTKVDMPLNKETKPFVDIEFYRNYKINMLLYILFCG